MKIFHLVEPSDWAASLALGSHEPPGLASEGFIHFSFEDQLLDSANRHYADADALFAVVYDSETFGDGYVVEDTSGHGEYPHVYQAISPSDSVEVLSLKKGPDGWAWP